MNETLSNATFFSVFVASILGSLHCVAMCGGLVLLAGENKRAPFLGQLYYSIGRGISYSILGLLAGLLGRTILANLKSPYLIWTAAAVVSLVALTLLYRSIRTKPNLVKISLTIEPAERGISFGIKRLFSKVKRIPLLLGFITAALPCGWLYSFVLIAASTGDALSGMRVMVAFWLGTLPALLASGGAFMQFFRTLNTKFPRATALIILVSAILSLSTHLTPKPEKSCHSMHKESAGKSH